MAPAHRRQHLVYADGSCLGNPGPGGWGVLFVEGDEIVREMGGGDPHTTNNRMEITAVIEALRATPPGATLMLRTDSQYVVNTMTRGWKRHENLDLWRQLDAEVAKRDVTFEWVRGHAGNSWNERADEIARKAATEAAKTGRSSTSRPSIGPLFSKAPRAAAADSSKADSISHLRTILKPGEAIRECAGCGRAFVSRGDADFAGYCSLAECQFKARSARSSV